MDAERALTILRTLYPWPAERPCPEIDHVRPGWLEEDNKALFRQLLSPDTRLIVELGSWCGLSARYMLDCAPNAVCLCVDHWRGSDAHREDPYFADYCEVLYEVFLMLCWDYRERIIPLRATTRDGIALLHSLHLQPDLVYLDADHRYESVRADLADILDAFPGAVVVGDDYAQAENAHMAVRRAVKDELRIRGMKRPKTRGGAFWIPPRVKT